MTTRPKYWLHISSTNQATSQVNTAVSPQTPRNFGLTGSLRSMRHRSIGQVGRALVRSVEPRLYMALTPVKFFTECYDLRSALVHGSDPLPTRSEIDLHGANLTLLVSDLIGLRHCFPPPSAGSCWLRPDIH